MVKSEKTYSLTYLLETKPTKELHILAQLYKFRGYSGFTKKQLSEKLVECIKNTAGEYLSVLNSQDLGLFEGLVGERSLVQGRLGRAALFISLGWASVVEERGSSFFVIAKEIKELYEQYKEMEEFKEFRQERQMLRTYRNALINLYGVVELYWMQHLYQIYQGKTIPLVFMMKDIQYINEIYGGCKMITDYLVHESLYDEQGKILQEFKKDTANKDYYIPTKQQIHLFEDEVYYEETISINKVSSYLEKHIIHNVDVIEEAIISLVLRVRVGEKAGLDLMEEIMEDWYRLGINIQSMEHLQQVTVLLTAAMKDVRRWRNKGYTANEMRRILFPDLCEAEPKKASSLKIGRNDPCICGSGKKYKKCCLQA